MSFSTSTAIISDIRDRKYVNACDNAESFEDLIISAHTTAKAFVYFPVLIVTFCAVEILYSSVRKWTDGFPTITNEWHQTVRNITDPATQRNGSSGATADLSDVVYNKFYDLYSNYIKVGEDTLLERKALRRWFVLIYFMYLIFILVQLVHLLLLGNRIKYHFDLAHSCLNIVMYFIAFFLPYYMATWLNIAHQKYHRKMMDTYLEIKITLHFDDFSSDSVQSISYLCKPGNINVSRENHSILPMTKDVPYYRKCSSKM